MWTDTAFSGKESFDIESSPTIGAVKPDAHVAACGLGQDVKAREAVSAGCGPLGCDLHYTSRHTDGKRSERPRLVAVTPEWDIVAGLLSLICQQTVTLTKIMHYG